MPATDVLPPTAPSLVPAGAAARITFGKALLWIAFIASVTLATATVAHHEPWRDEADVWLYARDQTLSGIWSRTGYIGSPMLWCALVYPFAQLGAPYLSLNLLNLCMGIGALALLTFKSPFPLPIRLALPFTYLFLYEYPVVARSYALSILLIFALASLHKVRFARPILFCSVLALLANTNAHSLVIASAIFAAFAWQCVKERKRVLPCLIASGGIALAIFQMLPPADSQFFTNMPINFSSPYSAIMRLFYPAAGALDPHWMCSLWEQAPDALRGCALAMTAALLVSILAFVRKNRWALWCLLSSYMGISVILMKWNGGIRHAGFFLVAALYAMWVTVSQQPQATGTAQRRIRAVAYCLLFASLIYSIPSGLKTCHEDIIRPFSCSKEVASVLNTYDHSIPVMTDAPTRAEALLPYMPGRKFYYPAVNEFGTYMQWTLESHIVASPYMAHHVIRQVFSRKKPLLLLTISPDPLAHKYNFELLYATKEQPIRGGESYWLYGRGVQRHDTNVASHY